MSIITVKHVSKLYRPMLLTTLLELSKVVSDMVLESPEVGV